MGVLVYVEAQDGALNKKAFEIVTYARKAADALNTNCVAVGVQLPEADKLGDFGAQKVVNLTNEGLKEFDNLQYAKALIEVAGKYECNQIILQHNANGKALLGTLAAKLDCASVSAVSELPKFEDGQLKLTKAVFSGKAFADYATKSEKAVWSVPGNTIQPEAIEGNAEVINEEVSIGDAQVKVLEVSKVSGETPLPEAELVVSGGRGFKGPENWHILEDLSNTLGAATACSRPVADSEWRPHHEHVGQTGIAIRPNLYIAIGISGAIQHLAGVNNSNTIVVINKDPEAPFFKAADYGVVGDLFDVVPRLTEALRAFKQNG